MTWTTDLLNSSGRKLHELNVGHVTATARQNTAGNWRATTALRDLPAGITATAVRSIRIRDGRDVIFSGPVTPGTTGSPGIEEQDHPTGTTITWRGLDEWAAPASRLAYPDPTTEPPWPDTHDTRTGRASTIIAEYLRHNLGDLALTDRQISLIVEDKQVGPAGTYSARLQQLDQLITRIANDAGLTVRFRSRISGELTARITAGTDRTSSVRYTDAQDLTAPRILTVPTASTYVIGAGTGEGTGRTFTTAGTGATGRARLETLNDQSNLSATAELTTSTSARLTRDAETVTIDSDVTLIAADRYEYLRDWDIGDTVAVQVRGIIYPVTVTGAQLTQTPTEQRVTPILGPAQTNRLEGLLTDVSNLSDRLSNEVR